MVLNIVKDYTAPDNAVKEVLDTFRQKQFSEFLQIPVDRKEYPDYQKQTVRRALSQIGISSRVKGKIILFSITQEIRDKLNAEKEDTNE